MKGKSIAPLLLRRLKGMEQWRNRAPIAFPNLPAIAPEQGGAIVRNAAQLSKKPPPTMAKAIISHCVPGLMHLQTRAHRAGTASGMSEGIMNIRVINYASGLRPNPGEVEIYVGRSRWVGISPLGNPFSRAKHGREQCIVMFRDWLMEKLTDPTSDQAIELESIRQIAKDHPLALRCHCAPLPCHADVIKELIEGSGIPAGAVSRLSVNLLPESSK